MVDEHGLLLQPKTPAVLTDVLDDASADGARERLALKAGLALAASTARDVWHDRGKGCRNLAAGRAGCGRGKRNALLVIPHERKRVSGSTRTCLWQPRATQPLRLDPDTRSLRSLMRGDNRFPRPASRTRFPLPA